MSERPQINFEQLAADIRLLQEVGEEEFRKILRARFGVPEDDCQESENNELTTEK